MTLELEERHVAPTTHDIYTAAALEASIPLFEMVGMPADDQMLAEFLTTKDGKQMLAGISSLLVFIAMKKAEQLGKEAR